MCQILIPLVWVLEEVAPHAGKGVKGLAVEEVYTMNNMGVVMGLARGVGIGPMYRHAQTAGESVTANAEYWKAKEQIWTEQWTVFYLLPTLI